MSENNTPPSTDGTDIGEDERRRVVRERYADIADDDSSCCEESDDSSCCGEITEETDTPDEQSRLMGYSKDELEVVPEGANLGLGCGNPTAIANLSAGETVLDLGSGAGFDCFLAARNVGAGGRVIGVDMTPEMIEKARENSEESDQDNLEFRLGEIEHLPVADETVDVILSNCVVNLSPDKPRVFDETFRVLKPGGRLAISDVVKTAPLPDDVRLDPSAVAGCVAGASTISELESMLDSIGFVDVSIEPKEDSEAFIRDWDPDRDLSEYIVSARIEGRKPASD